MDLSLYETAYLCGGPDRAARTALLSLHAAASVRVTESSLHRVERAPRRAGHPIEMALLDGLPSSGLPARLVLRNLVNSSGMDRCAAVLLRKKLLHRSFRGLIRPTRAGAELRERLAAETAETAEAAEAAEAGYDALVRFAVLGSLPEELRPVLVRLPPEAKFPIGLSRRRTGRGHDDRGDYKPPLGYADGYGAE